MNKCKRCGRMLKDPLADYGPVCVKKVAGSTQILDWELPDGTIETRNEKGELIEMIV